MHKMSCKSYRLGHQVHHPQSLPADLDQTNLDYLNLESFKSSSYVFFPVFSVKSIVKLFCVWTQVEIQMLSH